MNIKKIFKEQTLSLEGERSLFNNVLKGCPNPKFERSNYISLNGRYNLEVTKSKLLPGKYTHEIIVPYVIESILSQFNKIHNKKLYYHFKTAFELSVNDIKDVILLNINRINGEFEIYINGKYVSSSSNEFMYSIDIKDYVLEGINTLNISIKDKENDFLGICGPIYLTPLNKNYIKDINVYFDKTRETFTFKIDSNINEGTIKLISPNGRYKEYYYNNESAEIIPEDFIYYSINNPFFYQYEVKNQYDSIKGFVGISDYSIDNVDGINCITMNNEPISIKGIINKNYYSDGILTPPSYDHVDKEIAEVKKYHFNSIYNPLFIDCPHYYYYLEINGLLSSVSLNHTDKNLYNYINFFKKFNNIYLIIINNDSKTKNSREIYNEIKPFFENKLLVVVKKKKQFGDIDISQKRISKNKPYIKYPLSFKNKSIESFITYIENDYLKDSIKGMAGYYFDSLKDKETGILSPNFKKRQNKSKLLLDYYK